jgi:hypothetical protein
MDSSAADRSSWPAAPATTISRQPKPIQAAMRAGPPREGLMVTGITGQHARYCAPPAGEKRHHPHLPRRGAQLAGGRLVATRCGRARR